MLNKEHGSTSKIYFLCSKKPYLHSTYSVPLPFHSIVAVNQQNLDEERHLRANLCIKLTCIFIFLVQEMKNPYLTQTGNQIILKKGLDVDISKEKMDPG